MGWWITLGILFLLAILPLGVSIHYNADGPVVKIILGPIKLTVVPAKKNPPKEKKEKPKKEKKPKKKAEKPKQVGADAPPSEPKPATKEKGGSILDFLPLVKTLFDFLGDFRRKLRIDNLQLKLIMAGGDPYNLAMNYGKAWAAVGNLLPKLEQWFVIRKRDIEVECDFVESKTTIIAHMDLTITVGRLLAAVLKFAFKALIKFLQIKKKRKGGANNEPDVT
jgi:hypothetical protein